MAGSITETDVPISGGPPVGEKRQKSNVYVEVLKRRKEGRKEGRKEERKEVPLTASPTHTRRDLNHEIRDHIFTGVFNYLRSGTMGSSAPPKMLISDTPKFHIVNQTCAQASTNNAESMNFDETFDLTAGVYPKI